MYTRETSKRTKFKVTERWQEHSLGQNQGTSGRPAINRWWDIEAEDSWLFPYWAGPEEVRGQERDGQVKQEAFTMSGSGSREQTYLHILLPLLILLLAAAS